MRKQSEAGQWINTTIVIDGRTVEAKRIWSETLQTWVGRPRVWSDALQTWVGR